VLETAQLDKQLIGQMTFSEQLTAFVNSVGLWCHHFLLVLL